MLRGLILLILAIGLAVLAAPFVISSLYVDERGITIPGRVTSKSETVTVHYSDWKRVSDVTIEYSSPETAGVSFFTVPLDFERYDALHKGDTVSLHYLRPQDTPTVPMANVLRELHALPTVRLADQRTFSRLEAFFTRKVILICEGIASIVVLLFVWRKLRLPLFGWAAGICIALGVGALLIYDFPTPTRRPTTDVRKGSGRVKSIDRIDRLFEGNRSQGADADQPIDVVGIEFVPAGATQPVVAVDLVDQGSIPELGENATVAIAYEAHSPRTAWIENATRNFVARNIAGIAVQGIVLLIVLIVFLAGAQFLGRAFNQLIQRRTP
jgi:hypothetical protein